VGRSVFKRGGRVVDSTLGLGQNVGTAVAKHANATVKNVLRRRNRKNSRRNSRKNTRRNNRK
jgi:hypothetical protein